MPKIRNLKEDEIECKVAMINEKGLQILLYKTARTDKAILDEVYGEDGWYNEYEEIKGNLFCAIYIWSDTRNMWIKKQDCGVESAFGDKEKGEASDAFKRAGFKVRNTVLNSIHQYLFGYQVKIKMEMKTIKKTLIRIKISIALIQDLA